MSVALVPAQTVVIPVIPAEAGGVILTACIAVPLHPPELTVTVYVVFAVGKTVIDCVIADVLQL